MKPLLVVCGLLFQSMLFACGGVNQPVYAGQIEYSLDAVNPLICNVTLTMDFDINESLANDSMWVDWGDEQVGVVRAISIVKDSVASANTGGVNIYTHVYRGSHTYASLPNGGYYYVSFQNEYRINGVSNIASGDGVNLPFYLMAQVSIDTVAGKQYTPLAFPPLSIGFAGFNSYVQNGLQQQADNGDSIVYSFNTPLETISNPVPEYLLPSQFCQANGSENNSFTIDPVTGNVVWTSPCLQGIYCFGTILSKYHNGQLVSSVMREQNIYVNTINVNGIQNVKSGGSMQVYPDPVQQTLSGNVSAATSGVNEKLEIIATDGRVIVNDIAVKDGRFQADVSSLSNGVYFLRLQGSADVITLKFFKQ